MHKFLPCSKGSENVYLRTRTAEQLQALVSRALTSQNTVKYAKVIYREYYTRIDLGSGRLLCNACSLGVLSAVKFILRTCEERRIVVDIHVNEEEPFRHACKSGHLEVAKYLFNVSKKTRLIDIRAKGDWAIKAARDRGHKKVVHWLSKIYPR